MRPITRDILTREIIGWHQQGLIDRPLLETLLPRYETQGRFLAVCSSGLACSPFSSWA